MDLKIRKNTSTLRDIVDHLSRNDSEFIPKLSSRVQIDDYSKKIFDYADRYEAFSRSNIVGLIAVYKTKELWFITSVSVDRSQREFGLGSRLMSAIIDDAAHTSPAIQLEVNVRSAAAISLYGKFGFKIAKDEGDVLVMERATENEEL